MTTISLEGRNQINLAEQNIWVTMRKAQDIFGYSPEAFRGKINRRQLIQGQHWRKAPDNKLLINLKAFNEWLQSREQE